MRKAEGKYQMAAGSKNTLPKVYFRRKITVKRVKARANPGSNTNLNSHI